MRCRVWWPSSSEDPILYSSQGNPILGVPHVIVALKAWVREVPSARRQWDGELYCHNLPFEEIISRTTREAELHEDYLAIEFHIFDFIPEFEEMGKLFFYKRMITLKREVSQFEIAVPWEMSQIIKAVPTFEVQEDDYSLSVRIAQFLDAHYEGIIIRNPYNIYQFKRPFTILKWKPAKKDWYRISDCIEAVSKDKTKLGELGALLCQDRFGNLFRVGTGIGITRERKKALWENRATIKERGLWAEVTYQNLTSAGVPRFGKVVRITEHCGETDNWEN